MSRLYTGYIDEDQCMGDTLGPKLGGVASTINENFYNLDVRVQTLTGTTNTQDAQILNLNTRLNSLSSQLLPTVLFVPVNYSTQSNAAAPIATWTATGTTSAEPWWSGYQSVTLSNVPANTIGALIEVFANTNARVNNLQRIYFYKSGEEAIGTPVSGKIFLPVDSSSPSNITQTQFNNITNNSENYRKMQLDPAGTTEGTFEAEHSVTFPVYTSFITSTSRQFRWFWTDNKASSDPITANPIYNLTIRLVGYYVQVT